MSSNNDLVVENSDFMYFSECVESDQLLVIFSGAGSKSFNCFKLLADYPVNKLFIRDAGRSWYQHAVKGHWTDFDGLVERVRLYSDRFDADRVICIGGSMGGFAAMAVGGRLAVGKVLAFSPQTDLDYRLPNNPSASIKIKYKNAFELLSQSPVTEVKLYIGTDDLADLYNVFPATRYNSMNIEFVWGGPHNLMNFFFQNGMLFNVIRSYVEGVTLNCLYPTLNLLEYPVIYRKICDFVRGFYFDESDFESLQFQINELLKTGEQWPALHHWNGKLHAKYGDHKAALQCFEQAISLNSCQDGMFFDLGLSAIQAKEYARAEVAFRKADELSPAPSPLYLSKLGATLMLQKDYDAAIEMQKAVLGVSPRYVAAFYQLGLVMNITGRFNEAIPYFEQALEYGDKNPMTQRHLKTARDNVEKIVKRTVDLPSIGKTQVVSEKSLLNEKN
jgi:tetratricopeptide (TPR) repeat protein